jgi:hypothetical protein
MGNRVVIQGTLVLKAFCADAAAPVCRVSERTDKWHHCMVGEFWFGDSQFVFCVTERITQKRLNGKYEREEGLPKNRSGRKITVTGLYKYIHKRVHWIHLAQDRGQWWVHVNTIWKDVLRISWRPETCCLQPGQARQQQQGLRDGTGRDVPSMWSSRTLTTDRLHYKEQTRPLVSEGAPRRRAEQLCGTRKGKRNLVPDRQSALRSADVCSVHDSTAISGSWPSRADHVLTHPFSCRI